MQESCTRRTAELQQRCADPTKITEEDLHEFSELQATQQRLADLMQNLLTRLLQDQPDSAPGDAPSRSEQETPASTPETLRK